MDNITTGNLFVFPFSFTQDDVVNFANASGDYNPIHLDQEYAAKTIFKSTIIHGFLGGSVFSRVFGTIWPGNGTIYLKQTMTFYKPMFTNVPYTSRFEVVDVLVDKNRATIRTSIFDDKDQIIIDGEAIIKHPMIK